MPSNRDHIDSPSALSHRAFLPSFPTEPSLRTFHSNPPSEPALRKPCPTRSIPLFGTGPFCIPMFQEGDSSDCGGMSTPGHGQGVGPDGDKWSTDHAGYVGRGRSERSERSPPQSLLSFRFNIRKEADLKVNLTF